MPLTLMRNVADAELLAARLRPAHRFLGRATPSSGSAAKGRASACMSTTRIVSSCCSARRRSSRAQSSWRSSARRSRSTARMSSCSASATSGRCWRGACLGWERGYTSRRGTRSSARPRSRMADAGPARRSAVDLAGPPDGVLDGPRAGRRPQGARGAPAGQPRLDLAPPPDHADLELAAELGHRAVWARGLGRRAPVTVGRSQWMGLRRFIEEIEGERRRVPRAKASALGGPVPPTSRSWGAAQSD